MTTLSDHDRTEQIPVAPRRFKAGEIVDITIKGVEITNADPFGIDLNLGPDATASFYSTRLPTAPTSVTVHRASPFEWPPKDGDVWLDSDGDQWFGIRAGHNDGKALLIDFDGNDKHADEVLSLYGPLTLAFRHGKVVDPS